MNNRWFKKQQGFTLIEIIIVVIILGILAAVGLPRIVENINKGRVAEAFSVGNTVAGAFDRCLAQQSGGVQVTSANVLNCSTVAELNVAFPTGNFNYNLGGPAADPGGVITMTAAGAWAGAAGDDMLTFTYNGLTGAVTKACSTTSNAIPTSLCQ